MRVTPGREAGRARCLCWGARRSQAALPVVGRVPEPRPRPDAGSALWPQLCPSPRLPGGCGPPPQPLFSRGTHGESPSPLWGCVYRCPGQGSSVRGVPSNTSKALPAPTLPGHHEGPGRVERAGPAPKFWVVSCLCP